MDVLSFLKPNIVKAYFTIVFMLPVATLSAVVFLNDASAISGVIAFFVICVGFVGSYILACGFDYAYKKTENRWIKLILIAFATLASFGAAVLLVIMFYASRPVICDPVHRPPPGVCDPVHQPTGSAFSPVGLYTAKISGSGKQKYQELMRKLRK